MRIMSDFKEIGDGGIWIKEGRKGKFLSWKITFLYNGHQVTANGVAFKNEKKEGQQPDYRMKVSDAFPAKPRETKQQGNDPPPNEDDSIPF